MRKFCVFLGLFSITAGGAYTAQNQVAAHYLDLGSEGKARLLAADAAGNLFTISNVVEPSGRPQIRVIKTDAQLNILATIDFGSSLTDTPAATAVDSQGNLVIAGTTSAPDFPLVSPLLTNTTTLAAFVTKLDPQLHILFSSRVSGTQGRLTAGSGVALDQSGNIILTGSTDAPDFPVTANAFQTQAPTSNAFGTSTYSFLTKISADGSRILFSTYFGTSGTNCSGGSSCIGVFGTTAGTAVAVDATGAIFLAGNTTASDLPVTAGAYAQQCNGCARGSTAGFLAKFSTDGAKLLWATYLPLADRSQSIPLAANISILAMALDAGGNILVGGTAPVGFPTTAGSAQPSYPAASGSGPAYAGFVSKFDPSAQRLLFSTYLGGNVSSPSGSTNGVLALALDSLSNVWVTGGSVPSQLPLPGDTAIVGQTYFGALAPDGSRLSVVWTAPNGATGRALVITGQNVVTLGPTGSLLVAGPASGPSVLGVANSAGTEVSAYVSPYELVSFYGVGLGPANPAGGQVVNGALTTSLGGVQVLFDNVPAPLLYAGPSQVNAIVPSLVNGRNATSVQIVTPSGTINGPQLLVRPSQPEVFTYPPQAQLTAAIALNQDGKVNSPTQPAAPGSIVTVWATGAGMPFGAQPDGAIVTGAPRVPELSVSVLGGQNFDSLEVLYAGDAPSLVAGVMQVNFRLPAQISPGLTSITCQLQVGIGLSGGFSIYVKPM